MLNKINKKGSMHSWKKACHCGWTVPFFPNFSRLWDFEVLVLKLACTMSMDFVDEKNNFSLILKLGNEDRQGTMFQYLLDYVSFVFSVLWGL